MCRTITQNWCYNFEKCQTEFMRNVTSPYIIDKQRYKRHSRTHSRLYMHIYRYIYNNFNRLLQNSPKNRLFDGHFFKKFCLVSKTVNSLFRIFLLCFHRYEYGCEHIDALLKNALRSFKWFVSRNRRGKDQQRKITYFRKSVYV